jgi:hypothetical protein
VVTPPRSRAMSCTAPASAGTIVKSYAPAGRLSLPLAPLTVSHRDVSLRRWPER